MKKFLSLALVSVFALTLLAGCGSGGSTTSPAASAAASASAAATTAAASVKTVTAGTLTMATNAEFPPYEFKEGDKIVGIDAEVAAAIAAKLGLKLQIDNMDFTSLIAAVQNGKADMSLAGMTVTEERKQSIDFSDSYATGVQVIIVKTGSKITTPDDLKKGGFTIGVQESTTGDIYTTSDYGDKKIDTINRYNKGADAVQALVAGKVDCVVIDNEPAKSYVAANKGLSILTSPYIEEQYAIAMPKTNKALGEAVNKALKDLIADGTVKKIVDKYIKAG